MSARLRCWLAAFMALIVSVALLVGLSSGAFAGEGGGAGESGGGGTVPADMSIQWKVKDSWAASRAGVEAALNEMGYSSNGSSASNKVIDNSINKANAECAASYTGSDDPGCRLVGVGIAVADGKWYPENHIDIKSDWMSALNTATKDQTHTYGGATWDVSTQWTDKNGTRSVSKLAEASVDAKLDASLRVIVLTKDQPAPPETAPEKPAKSIERGTSADSMRNTTTITSGTGVGGTVLDFRDTFRPNGVAYTVENLKVTDTTDGSDRTGDYTFNTQSGGTPADDVLTATYQGGRLPDNHDWAFTFDVVVSKPSISRVEDTGNVHWHGSSKDQREDTPSYEFPTWKPNPDKAWVSWDETASRWQTVIDPTKSNQVGADNQTFLDGDRVASVVNGTVAKNLINVPEKLVLSDDFKNADYLWNPDAVSTWRVYAADMDAEDRTYVDDIAATGRDVTSMFTLGLDGTTATATAKPEYLKTLKGMAKAKQLSFLIPGTANYANGGGAAQVRKDLGMAEGEEAAFCGVNNREFTNSGSQIVNDHEIKTNEPKICGYVPPVKKEVVSEGSQGGEQESVDGKVVFPGQKVEYVLDTQPKLPDSLAYEIKSVTITDTFDEYLTPDKQTLEVTDLTTGKMVSKKQYSTTWDDKSHSFQLKFDSAYITANWGKGTNPRISIRFEGTVSKTAPTTHKVNNQWALTLNNSLTPSNEVYNIPPGLNPKKEDTSSKNPTISIDGKTLLLGETGNYVLTLDAKNVTKDNTAYKVQRLGMIDDFDDEYLKVDPMNIEVLAADGTDVTDRFNIQLKDGVVYVFAKTVDTLIAATGETIAGDPQPSDLKAYSERTLDPLSDPSIDQSLLGQQYQIILPYTVIKVTDGYVVKNTATQITNDRKDVTNTVSNPLKLINPAKDVTVKVGGESVSGKSVYKDRLFLYQLDSSILPADRAYTDVDEWSIADQLDPEFDQYTGQWAVYAQTDLYKDGQLLAAKGVKLAGSGVDSSVFGGVLFTLTATNTGLVTISATDSYRQLVSADSAHEHGWRAYIQCKRLKVTDRHENVFTERYNGQTRVSNIVWTKTPDLTPSLSIEKWDTKSGFPAGDRDSTSDALTVTGDTDITFTITNTSKTDPDTNEGAIFQAKDLNLEDATIAGDGTVVDLQYPDDWDTLVLKPGESVDVHGTLKGVTGKHTDRAKVTGTPLVSCPVDADGLLADEAAADSSVKTVSTVKSTDTTTDSDASSDDSSASATVETVTIDSQTYCAQPNVESNTDDWHGKAVLLAQTGTAVGGVVFVAVVLAGLALLLRAGACCHAGATRARHARR